MPGRLLRCREVAVHLCFGPDSSRVYRRVDGRMGVCVCVDGGMNGGLRAMCMDGGMDGWMRSCWVSLTALSACRNTRSRFSRRTAVITE